LVAMVWLVGAWVMWLRLAGRSGRPRVRDGGHAHIRGLAQDLCSSHVRCLKSSAAAGAVLRRQIAELVCASRGCAGRLASRNGNVD
jgi:hypothetical protein